MGVPEQTSRQEDNHEVTSLRFSIPSPWPWLPPRSKPHLALTLMLRLTPGTATTATDHMATEATTDPMATMATTERGLLMPSPLMPLPHAPTLMLRLTPGTDTTDTGTGHTDMATMDMATDMDTTTERGLLMPSPLMPLLQALTLMLTPGTDTTGTGTDLMAMGTMATDLMVMLTGDKKWTSRTTSDLFLPTHL